jgi:hypothetical protein
MAATDISISFTPIAGGDFPDGYASSMHGGYHIAATTTARNAIPDYRRDAGMLCWVTAGAGAMYQLKVAPWVGTDDDWTAYASAGGLSRVDYNFVNGEETTDVLSSSPLVIGAVYFDPNTIIPVSGGRTRHVTLEVFLETSSVSFNAIFGMYDVSGISLGGTPGIITNAAKQTTNLATTRFTQSLDTELGSVTTAGLLEARLSVQTPGPAYAICKQARLIVTWD